MNFKTTLALLVLAAAGGALVFLGPSVPSAVNPLGQPTPPADLGTVAELERITPDRLLKIEVRAGDRVTVVQRRDLKPGGAWEVPGGWPSRAAEVNALADLVSGLRTRFRPEPIPSAADLARFGLNPPAATLVLTLKDEGGDPRTVTLSLGVPPSDDPHRATRPTYARLGDREEVVRLEPGLVAALDRPADFYVRPRLFPSTRVAREGDPKTKTDQLAAQSLLVEEKKDKDAVRWKAVKSGTEWELVDPDTGNRLDRLDPTASRSLLEAVPELWAERFHRVDPNAPVLAVVAFNPLGAAAWATVTGPDKAQAWLLARAGLDKPERTITASRDGSSPITLEIGAVAGTRPESARPPAPGMPPTPPAATEYRFAKLKGYDLVFEVKADKLKDVFVSLDSLRDARVARISPADVVRVELTTPGQPPVVLSRPVTLAWDSEKGFWTTAAVKPDRARWKLDKPLQSAAENDKVNELLDKLTALEARGDGIIDKPDLKNYDLDKEPSHAVTLTYQKEPTAEEEKDGKPGKRGTVRLAVGKHDAAAKKVYVKEQDWPRVNAADDSLVALLKRDAQAYRGKRRLEFAASDLASLDVKRSDGTHVTLKQDKDGWKLTAPVETAVDRLKAQQLADTLGRLEAVEYVEDNPKKEDVEGKYGLDNSAVSVTLAFKPETGKQPRTLLVGKAREGKTGRFAKFADEAVVFAVGDTARTQLDRDSLAYLPGELWQVAPDDITTIQIRKDPEEAYTLKRDGEKWKVEGPFAAEALAEKVIPLAQDLAAPRCDSYKTHEAKNLADYGLDKPYLTVTVTDKTGKVRTLLVGKQTEKDAGTRFAKLADAPGVCVLPDFVVKAAERGPVELLDTLLLQVEPSQLEKLQTKTGDATLTLERGDGGWKVKESPAGEFDADAEAMSVTRGVWVNLRAAKFAAYGPKVDWAKYGLAKPFATVTATLKKDGDKPAETRTVELGKEVEGQPGARYARIDKGPGVAVLTTDTTRDLARTYLDFANRTMLTVDEAGVKLIQRHAGAEVLELVKKNDAWSIVKPTEQPADEKGMQQLLMQLAQLRAAKVAAYPIKDLKPYGLDAPSAIFTIQTTKGDKTTEKIFKLGKVADEATGDRYVLSEDGKSIGVLPGPLARRLTAKPVAFRDRAVAKFADADKVRVERGPRKAAFARVDGSWKLVEPLNADADNDELEEFINTLAKLRADELVAYKPTPDELKRYGLDKPEAVWKLSSGDKDVLILQVGAREKDGSRVHARLAGGDLVFLLDPKLTTRALGEFRTRTVWPQPLDAVQVESVRLTPKGGNPLVLEKGPDGQWQAAGKPDAKINPQTVSETLAALAGLRLERYAVDKGADLALFGLNPAELTIDAFTRSGKQTLLVGRTEGDSKRYYARVAGSANDDVFVLSEADGAKLVRDLAAFGKSPARPTPPLMR